MHVQEIRVISLGFTGTRFGCSPHQLSELRRAMTDLLLIRDSGPGVGLMTAPIFIHGGCVGADTEFHVIARQLMFPSSIVHVRPGPDGYSADEINCEPDEFSRVVVHDPDTHMRRNRAIVSDASVMFACPLEMEVQERGGTWKTIGFTRRAMKPLAIFWRDGTVTKENW